jgi:hypothetical protein
MLLGGTRMGSTVFSPAHATPPTGYTRLGSSRRASGVGPRAVDGSPRLRGEPPSSSGTWHARARAFGGGEESLEDGEEVGDEGESGGARALPVSRSMRATQPDLRVLSRRFGSNTVVTPDGRVLALAPAPSQGPSRRVLSARGLPPSAVPELLELPPPGACGLVARPARLRVPPEPVHLSGQQRPPAALVAPFAYQPLASVYWERL